jgi:hypothetical protein
MVPHSPLDIGSAGDLFDGNADTLIRGRAANPLVLELRFSQPRGVTALGLTLATMPRFQIKVGLTRADGTTASIAQDYHDLPADSQVELAIPGGQQRVHSLRIEIYDRQPRPGDGPHIHVRDVQVRYNIAILADVCGGKRMCAVGKGFSRGLRPQTPAGADARVQPM